MNSRFRNVLKVALAAAALGSGSLALADGIASRAVDKARERGQEQRSEGRAEGRSEGGRSESRPQRSEQPARAERPARNEPARSEPARSEPARQQQPARQSQPSRQQQPERVAGGSSGVLRDALRARDSREADASRNRQAAPQPSRPVTAQPRTDAAGVAPRPSQRVETAPSSGSNRQAGARGNDRDADRTNGRGVLGTLAREQARDGDDRGGDGRGGDGRGGRDNDGRDWDRDDNANRDRGDRRDGWRDHDRRRTVRVVNRLPYGYRDYLWNGGRYYYYDGYWYRPHGTSFISVGIPYGLFVTTLPGAYTSVWIGGSRYYYSDYHYYTYEPARRGYVVVRSPYGDDYVYDDDENYVDSRLDDELYIYPAQGQSEQQQADDRYDCHRWAVSETGYDPIDDEYEADLREDYLRALTACLTGRGYTVR